MSTMRPALKSGAEAPGLLPWQQTWNGRTWEDMPGPDSDFKKINFALWRRGKLALEEAAVDLAQEQDEAQYVMREDGTKEVRQMQHKARWLPPVAKRNPFRRRSPAPRVETAQETEERLAATREVEEAASLLRKRHAAAKARVAELRKTWGALSKVDAVADFQRGETSGYLLGTEKLGPARLGRLEKALDVVEVQVAALKAQVHDLGLESALEALPRTEGGRFVPRPYLKKAKPQEKRHRYMLEGPPGTVPFPLWLEAEAKRLKISTYALRWRLNNGVLPMPEMVQNGPRRRYVRVVESGVAA